MRNRSQRNTACIAATIAAIAGAMALGAPDAWSQGSLTRTDFAATSDLNGVGTGQFSTATFTPANNSLQVVAVHASAESNENMQGSDLTLSNSAGLTCTLRLTSPDPPASTWGHGFRVWTCPVTTGTSMIFTADAGSYDIHQYVIERFEFTGHDTSSPTGATATATDNCTATDCPVTITLSAAPASSSQVLAFTSVNGGCNGGSGCNPAPGSGWTEIHDLVDTSHSWGEYQSQVRTGSTSISVSWADLNSGNRNPDGAVLGALEIRAASGGGGGDTVPPTITITAPPNNVFTNNAATVITGSVSEPATLTINGQSVPTPNNSFSYTTALQQGANNFSLSATDAANNVGQNSLVINLDTTPPAAANPALISVGAPVGGQVTVSGQAGAVESSATVRIRNIATGTTVTTTAAGNGSFSGAIGAGASDSLLIEVIDAAGNVSQAIAFGNGGTTMYGYDELGRIKTVTSPNGSNQRITTYTYDASGNRDTVVTTVN